MAFLRIHDRAEEQAYQDDEHAGKSDEGLPCRIVLDHVHAVHQESCAEEAQRKPPDHQQELGTLQAYQLAVVALHARPYHEEDQHEEPSADRIAEAVKHTSRRRNQAQDRQNDRHLGGCALAQLHQDQRNDRRDQDARIREAVRCMRCIEAEQARRHPHVGAELIEHLILVIRRFRGRASHRVENRDHEERREQNADDAVPEEGQQHMEEARRLSFPGFCKDAVSSVIVEVAEDEVHDDDDSRDVRPEDA